MLRQISAFHMLFLGLGAAACLVVLGDIAGINRTISRGETPAPAVHSPRPSMPATDAPDGSKEPDGTQPTDGVKSPVEQDSDGPTGDGPDGAHRDQSRSGAKAARPEGTSPAQSSNGDNEDSSSRPTSGEGTTKPKVPPVSKGRLPTINPMPGTPSSR